MPRLLLFCSLVTLVGTGWGPALANAKLVHGVLWYGKAPDSAPLEKAALRYTVGVTGKNDASDPDKIEIKTLNPQFEWYVYNSGTDNYVPPKASTEEYDALVNLARSRGLDPEIAYLHYWDDTHLVLEGDTLFLPGWGGGSATDPAQSRVPVYYKNLTRRVCNFSSPKAAAIHRQAMVSLAFDTPFSGSNIYPDGIFLDNSAGALFNFGSILSGGHVRETPFHLLIGSKEFSDWWWSQNLGPYLASLKDTLDTSARWSKDGREKRLMINVSNIWLDDYVAKDVTDVYAMEFQYNPVRSFGLTAIPESHRHDALGALIGQRSFYMATNTRTVVGQPGSYTLPEIMLGNLCWFLLSRTSQSIFFQQGSNSPVVEDWESLTWIGAMDVADRFLGEAVGEPYVLAEGTDPLGYPYRIHAREYQAGFVVLRNRGSWDESIEAKTAVNAPLPRWLQPISPEGAAGPLVDSVTLRNGQGALFINELVTPVELSLTASRSENGALITWEITAGSESVIGFDVHREDGNGNRVKLNDASIPPDRPSFLDEDPFSGETRYWLAEFSRTGDMTWHGPATLAPALPAPACLLLAQNVPNPLPAGSSTLIQFEVPREGRVNLQIYDVTGRRVATLVGEVLPAGEHSASWNGRDENGIPRSPGIYFYRLNTINGTLSRRLLLVR